MPDLSDLRRGAARRSRAAERRGLPDHAGRATWGERVVPLEVFAAAVGACGRELDEPGRRAAVAGFLSPEPDGVPVEGPFERIAVCGGVYSNRFALEALLDDAHRRGVEAVYCLGDLGGFGPHPERVRPLLEQGGVRTIRGNYEEALAAGAPDCRCGYADPRDNHYAAVSYRYTAERCSEAFRAWMGGLPGRRRVRVGRAELLLVHGSPRRVNEFLFESTTPLPFLETLLDRERCQALLFTHTGLHWHRRLPGGRDAVNVGALGRPANDGSTEVHYAVLSAGGPLLRVELAALAYDHRGLAAEMRAEGLPEEFVETILTGWWTTCLEVLPARERAASRF